MKTSRYLAIALCLALLCGVCMPAAFAAGYSDTAGHWAESSIERWSGYNIVEGYDGSFSPDDSLTRGQMAKILSNTLGLTETAENPFTDVPAGAWYTPYVLRCYAAGIMQGDGAMASPESAVTRQETVVMFCRALEIAPADSADLSSYADGGSVADWAAPYMAAATRAGIVNGVGGNQIAPLGDMTRAAFMTVLDRAVTQYINAPGSYTLTDKAGLILVAAGDVTLTGTTSANILVTPAASGKSVGFEKANVTGSITVKADNAKVTSTDSTLPEIVRNGAGITVEKSDTTKPSGGGNTGSSGSGSSGSSGGSGGGSSSGGGNNKPTNLTVAEEKTVNSGTYQDVTITEAVGDGTVTLSNMTIQGNLYINGGGSNTINLDKVTIKGKIIISKTDGEPPRLHLSNTPVKTVETTKPAIIEADDAASVVTDLKAGADVTIQGEKTAVSNLTVPKSEGDAVVEIKVANATVSKIEAQGRTAITGETGKVEQVEAKAAVTVESAVVEKVVVPEEAENVVVDVRGEEAIEVEVNAENTTVTSEGDNVTVTGAEKDKATTHKHSWNEGEVTTEPTCSKEGVTTYTCAVENCPIKTKTEAIEKKPHTPVTDAAVAADCLGPGKTEGSHCSVCGEVLVAQEVIAPLGHNFSGEYTGDESGHWHVCSHCGAKDEVAAHSYPTGASCAGASECTVCHYVKPAGAHSYGDWKYKDATNHEHTCTVCGATEAAPHTWDAGVVTKEPTASAAGEKTYACSDCGGTKKESIPPVASDAHLELVQDSQGRIGVQWDDLGYPDYGYRIVDAGNNVVMSGNPINAGETKIVELSAQLPRLDSGTAKYSFVLYSRSADGKWGTTELGRIDNAFEVSISGTAADYTLKYDAENKRATATWNGTLPEGFYYLTAIYRENKLATWGSGSITRDLIYNFALEDGDAFDLRVLTAYTLEGQTLKATMTPASTKTYTAAGSEPEPEPGETPAVWFSYSPTGGGLYVQWADAAGLGSGEAYFINDMPAGANTYYTVGNFDFLSKTSDEDIAIAVTKGTVNSHETIIGETRIPLKVVEQAGNLSVSYQEQTEGTYAGIRMYRASGREDGYTGYYYNLSDPEGTVITGRCLTTMDGVFTSGAPYEGCCFNLSQFKLEFGASLNNIEDPYNREHYAAINSLTITRPKAIAISAANNNLPVAATGETTVETLAELETALRKGGTVVLGSDITEDTASLYANLGAPSTLKLNGHTLSLLAVYIQAGKELAIDGTVAGSGIVCGNDVNSYGIAATTGAELTIDGGSYGKLQTFQNRGFTATGASFTADEGAGYVVLVNTAKSASITNCLIDDRRATISTNTNGLHISDCGTVNLGNTTTVKGSLGLNNIAGTVTIDGPIVQKTGYPNSGHISIWGTTATLDKLTDAQLDVRSLNGNASNVTIKGGTYSGGGLFVGCQADSKEVPSTLTIEGGAFTSTANYIARVQDNCNLYIEGGEFAVTTTTPEQNPTAAVGYVVDQGASYIPGTVEVTGGAFNFDPSGYVPETHTATEAGGTWTVAAKED